jgi:Mitochondrial distribution and morphology protein 10
MSVSRTSSIVSRSTINLEDLSPKTRSFLLVNVLTLAVRECVYIQVRPRKGTQTYPDYLLYGRLYVPTGRLDALYSTRLSSTLQALVAAISDPRADRKQSLSTRSASSPSNIMLSLQHDTGRWCTEYTYSAEDSMVGVRMLHNFGKLAALSGSAEECELSVTSRGGGMKMKRIDEEDAMEGGLKGRFSAGAEIYFSAKERSAGGPCPPTSSSSYVVFFSFCVHL